MEMVELLPLDRLDDLNYVKSLLEEFVLKTESVVATKLLESWPQSASKFIKVFPYEYQRALKQLADETKVVQPQTKPTETINEPSVRDIEETINDQAFEKKRLEKILDKTRGFVKYPRETMMYRPAEKRLNDWDEIYNFQHVRKGLQMQAARCMECGVPFCQSSHGCPLGNIIPKWNDLVFHNNWQEALNQLLQTNNFPGKSIVAIFYFFYINNLLKIKINKYKITNFDPLLFNFLLLNLFRIYWPCVSCSL